MSSRSAAAAVRPSKPPARAAARRSAPVAAPSPSAEAKRLAADIQKALLQGRSDLLDPDALQALMSAACKVYAAQIEAGRDLLPLSVRSGVTPTEVMTAASGLLRAVNLAVFELGMWQSWTGR
jgi:hypothetical protein